MTICIKLDILQFFYKQKDVEVQQDMLLLNLWLNL